MRSINNHAKSRQLNKLQLFAKTVLSVLVVSVLQLNVYSGGMIIAKRSKDNLTKTVECLRVKMD